MHQSDPLFETSIQGKQVIVLFNAKRDFLQYFHFTMPFDLGVELQIPDEYFAVIWPACSDVRLILQRYCNSDSDWLGYSCSQCKYNEMITLIPSSKFKILLKNDDQNVNGLQGEYRSNKAPASCRILYIRKDHLESQQRKIFAVEFTISQHVTRMEQNIISDLAVIEQEERLRKPGCYEDNTNLYEALTIQLLWVYSRQYQSHGSAIIQPSRDTLASGLPALLRYIREHCRENLSVAQLAAMLNVHRCSLSRCFMKTYNVTLHDYLQNVRVKKIKQMLNDEELSISLISELFGYKGISSFSKFFRMKTGNTPTQYRHSIVNERTLGKSLDNS